MKLNISVTVFASVLAIGSITSADTINGSVNMDFVTIGNTNRTGDFGGTVGGVGYEYRISKTEVTVNQFNQSGITPQTNIATGASTPITGVSYHDAARYANWLTSGNVNVGAYSIDINGNVTGVSNHAVLAAGGSTVYVLATEDEWYKAAYLTPNGASFTKYANGTGTAPATSESLYNNAASAPWDVGSGLVLDNNGTYDMNGNVWEWLEDPTVVRGGAFNSSTAQLAKNNTFSFFNGNNGYDEVGIRIVAIPEPGTISLMSLSTISILITRRVRRRKQLGETLFPVRRARACDVFDGTSEWYDYEDLEDGYLAQLGESVRQQMSAAWGWLAEHYKHLDTILWNHMVAVHERKVAKRIAFRKACKTKLLNAFDAFLALIMK